MSTERAKRLMAELLGLHAATRRTDAKLSGAAERMHQHHDARASVLRERIRTPGTRDDDLEREYLDSISEADTARRY